MKHIWITSFKIAAEWDSIDPAAETWSSAVYQPHWLPQRPKAKWMDIRPDFKGTWIRPREYLDQGEPLEGYFNALRILYDSRIDMVKEWWDERSNDVAICCWCPYDKAAQRQIKEFGTFVCHTAAIGHFLDETFDANIHYDEDREWKMVRSETYIS